MASDRRSISSFCAWLSLVLLLVATAAVASWKIEPIRFAPGASRAIVQGVVVRGDQALYTIEAKQDQHMSLRITSPESNAVFQLYGPGAEPQSVDSLLHVEGESLPGAGEGDDAMQWSGKLPRSGRYLVVVGGTRGNATYRLRVEIR